jgi:hypothetical protein
MTSLNPTVTATYTTTEATTFTYTSSLEQTYYATTNANTLVQAPFSLTPKIVGFVAPKGKCSQYTFPVSLTAGTILNLAMTSTNPANLYLLPTYLFQTTPDGCQLSIPTAALLYQANFTQYLLHWTAPQDGVFYIILTGPTTIIMLSNRGSTQPVKQLANVTYATSTQTHFDVYLATATQTVSTTSTHPLYFEPQSVPGLEFLTLLTLVACAGLAGIAIYRRRH